MGGVSAKYGGEGHQPSMGGISQVWGGHQPTMGGGISHQYQLWGGHQPTMGGPSAKYGGVYSHQYIQEVKIHRITSKYGGDHQPTMGGHQPTMGGHQPTMGGSSTDYGGATSQVWGGYIPTSIYRKSKFTELLPSMGGVINQLWGGINRLCGGINRLWGGHQPSMGGGIFPPVCTGSQNPQNYFSNTYVLPAGPITSFPDCRYCNEIKVASFKMVFNLHTRCASETICDAKFYLVGGKCCQKIDYQLSSSLSHLKRKHCFDCRLFPQAQSPFFEEV